MDDLSTDIMNIIFDYLDFATLSTIAPVNKQFYNLSKVRYQSKIETEVLNPAKEMINDYINLVSPEIILFYIQDDIHDIFDTLTACERVLRDTESFLKQFTTNNYWILLVKDIELMEQFFVTMSRGNVMLTRYHSAINKFSSYDRLDDINTLYGKIQSYFDILDNYLYVEYPEKYSLYDLRIMARFKKIPKYFNMKTSKLKRALRRPLDEVYYLQD